MILLSAVVSTVFATSLSGSVKVPAIYAGKTVLNKPHMTEKVVALTFDDGPSSLTTPGVLDALKRYNAKATFFIVGQMASKQGKLLRRMVKEGHVVGNHSFSHPYRPGEVKAAYELKLTNRIIHDSIGEFPTLFRPPGGIMDSWTARLAKSQGMTSVIWTGSSADTVVSDSGSVYRNVINATHPGAIILMHDVKYHTAAAVPAILKTLKKNGYRCITVPEMLRLWEAAKTAQAEKATVAHKSAPGKHSTPG